MNELAFGTVFNDFYDLATTAGRVGVGAVRPAGATDSWDSSRSRACVCDAPWSGINCGERMCPSGNDAMATRADTSTANPLQQQVQKISLVDGGTDGKGTGAAVVNFVAQSFALRFTSKTNETFTTIPIQITVDGSDATLPDIAALNVAVEAALMALPNHVIDLVDVACTNEADSAAAVSVLQLLVTFQGRSVDGNQNLLEVVSDPCTAAGCTPKVTGLTNLISVFTADASSVSATESADYNSYECGRRGKCDGETGTCACFEGFTGQACQTITALV